MLCGPTPLAPTEDSGYPSVDRQLPSSIGSQARHRHCRVGGLGQGPLGARDGVPQIGRQIQCARISKVSGTGRTAHPLSPPNVPGLPTGSANYKGEGGQFREGCTCARICPCAKVNDVSGPFFREGGRRPPSQILSLRVYNIPTVSTIRRPRLLVVYGVYRLYPGIRVCANPSANYAKCLQTMHSLYAPCTVSAEYAQCLRTMHGVCRLYLGQRVCACCLQTMHSVYTLCIYMYTGCLQTIRIRAYPRIRIRVYIASTSCVRIHVYEYGYTCIRVCMYTNTGIHVYVCACIRIQVYMYTCIHVYKYGYTCICVCMYTNTGIHVYVYTRIQIRVYMYTCVHVNAYGYTCIRVYTSTNTGIHVYAYTRLRIRVYMYTRIHVYEYGYTCIRVYTRIHTCLNFGRG